MSLSIALKTSTLETCENCLKIQVYGPFEDISNFLKYSRLLSFKCSSKHSLKYPPFCSLGLIHEFIKNFRPMTLDGFS